MPGILGGIDANATNTLTGGAGNDFIVGNSPHFQNIIAGGAGTNVLNAEGQTFASLRHGACLRRVRGRS